MLQAIAVSTSLCEQQHMTDDDEQYTQYHDWASGQLVGVLYETLEGHGLTAPLTFHNSSTVCTSCFNLATVLFQVVRT